MAIPADQLETWSRQGATVGSSLTYAMVKDALEAATTNYAAKNYAVFLQGSYGNDTNIYAESDVDVVIRLDSIYHYDTSALTPQDLALFNASSVSATYFYANFKADVTAALQARFGVASIKPGNRAIKILSNANRRSADVIVATDFHRYYSASGILAGLAGMTGPQYVSGISFFTNEGKGIVNYPKQHSANCTAKHQATNAWFKPMVRIFKNMRGKLIANGAISADTASSYFIENMLFNVPNEKFGTSYSATFFECMKWLLGANANSFWCANQQQSLIKDYDPTCWPCSNCSNFLSAAAGLWDGWR